MFVLQQADKAPDLLRQAAVAGHQREAGQYHLIIDSQEAGQHLLVLVLCQRQLSLLSAQDTAHCLTYFWRANSYLFLSCTLSFSHPLSLSMLCYRGLIIGGISRQRVGKLVTNFINLTTDATVQSDTVWATTQNTKYCRLSASYSIHTGV